MSVTLPGDGTTVATVNVGGAEQQIVQVSSLPAVALDATALAALAQAATPATQAVSLAAPVAVTGAFFQATQPVSIAATVPVFGTFWQATQPVSGPLTDAQLRTTAVPVSGPATDAQLRATPLPVSMSNTLALTDAQLRAAAVPISGAVTANAGTGTMAVSADALPLPLGAATETTLAALNTKIPANGQAAMAASSPVVIASNQSAIPTLELATVIIGQATQTAVINNILDTAASANGTDVTNLRAAVVQIASTGTGGTFIFEQSLDSVNWRPLPVFNAELVTAAPITTAITATVSQIIYIFPIRGRFIRLRIVTTITGGSIQAFSRLSSDPWTPTVALVASPTAANLNATVSGTVTATVTGGTTLPVTPTTAFNNSAATTNPVSIKTSSGTVWSIVASNTNAAVRFLKMYNKASAPTVGTDVPVLTIPLPPGSVTTVQGGSNGLRFITGIAFAITALAADLDTTVIGASEVKVSTSFT